MVPFPDDKSDEVDPFISRGLGHESYSPTSDQALRSVLGRRTVREKADLSVAGPTVR
jgi:hypothetical protein